MTICCGLNTTQAEHVPKTTRIIFVENSHMLLQGTESPFLTECHFLLSQDRNRVAEEKKTITSSWSPLLHPSALFCHARGRWLTHLSRWPKLWKTYRQNYFYRPWLCRCCHQLAGHLKYLNIWVQTALWRGLLSPLHLLRSNQFHSGQQHLPEPAVLPSWWVFEPLGYRCLWMKTELPACPLAVSCMTMAWVVKPDQGVLLSAEGM